MAASIVDFAAGIHVFAVGLIEYFALDRVIGIGSYVVEGHENDIRLRNTIVSHQLVSMIRIRLVSIVPKVLRPCHYHSPMVFLHWHRPWLGRGLQQLIEGGNEQEKDNENGKEKF